MGLQAARRARTDKKLHAKRFHGPHVRPVIDLVRRYRVIPAVTRQERYSFAPRVPPAQPYRSAGRRAFQFPLRGRFAAGNKSRCRQKRQYQRRQFRCQPCFVRFFLKRGFRAAPEQFPASAHWLTLYPKFYFACVVFGKLEIFIFQREIRRDDFAFGAGELRNRSSVRVLRKATRAFLSEIGEMQAGIRVFGEIGVERARSGERRCYNALPRLPAS